MEMMPPHLEQVRCGYLHLTNEEVRQKGLVVLMVW